MAAPTRQKDNPSKQPSKLAKYAKLSSKRSPNAMQWSECDPEWVLKALHAVAEEGGALILGKTRDGGALAITLLFDGNKTTFYASDRKAAYDVLKDLADVDEI